MFDIHLFKNGEPFLWHQIWFPLNSRDWYFRLKLLKFEHRKQLLEPFSRNEMTQKPPNIRNSRDQFFLAQRVNFIIPLFLDFIRTIQFRSWELLLQKFYLLKCGTYCKTFPTLIPKININESNDSVRKYFWCTLLWGIARWNSLLTTKYVNECVWIVWSLIACFSAGQFILKIRVGQAL